MVDSLFSTPDLQQIAAHGIPEKTALEQMEIFKKGFPFTVLHRACTIDDGITRLQQDELEQYSQIYNEAMLDGRAIKFVPASGAASRMFQALLAVNENINKAADTNDKNYQDFLRFIGNIQQFAFYQDLKVLMAQHGSDIQEALRQQKYKDILENLLTSTGLNYARLPKALLKFHWYTDHARTPIEEHLAEAATYTQDRHKVARLHFTIAPEHAEAIHARIQKIHHLYEQKGVRYDITFSHQQPATDTLAVDLENHPFHDAQGNVLFRPGGHGALLTNLNALEADVVFIKNIDNVVPSSRTQEVYLYKRALGGYLLALQNQTFASLQKLTRADVSEKVLEDILDFAQTKLSLFVPLELLRKPKQEKITFLFSHLHRPLRVCGIVKNAGEPGGGPFWVQQADASLSLQIVEASQVDGASDKQRAIFASATHFNPVDLVCGVRDYQGRPFNLMQYTDPNTGFISRKTHQGRALKAFELPGLWNGAMAHWNTVFIEVPSLTFNPVKTVLDLLRPEHQP